MADRTVAGRSRLVDAIFSLVAIVVALGFAFPLYWSFSASLRNPIDQLGTPETVRSLTNSTIIAVSASILALLLGTPAAYAIARFEFRIWKNRDIMVWFLSQRILPPVATVIPFYLVMRTLGL